MSVDSTIVLMLSVFVPTLNKPIKVLSYLIDIIAMYVHEQLHHTQYNCKVQPPTFHLCSVSQDSIFLIFQKKTVSLTHPPLDYKIDTSMVCNVRTHMSSNKI